MKLAYVPIYDSRDIKNWSGLGYYIARCLELQQIQVEHVKPLQRRQPLLNRLKVGVYPLLFGKWYRPDRDTATWKDYATRLQTVLPSTKSDLVFSPGTFPIAYLDCNKPIAFWTDATFAGMIGFYPSFSNLCDETIAEGNALEQSALSRCDLAIYSSDWAARSAVENYQVNPEKVRVVPFGANIECRRELADVKQIVAQRPKDVCKLLFLGIDWSRKGGDLAVQVAEVLNQWGLPTELTVVGSSLPRFQIQPACVRTFGFISKVSCRDSGGLDRLISESHFLILPTRADCTPIVICEANSFGVPALTSTVGGLSTVVRDGLNGMKFPTNVLAEDYASYILELFSNYSRYLELALSSFNEYEDRLSWSAAGAKVKSLLEALLH